MQCTMNVEILSLVVTLISAKKGNKQMKIKQSG